MKYLGKIIDEDLGKKSVAFRRPIIRKSSRGIVINDEDEIAMFYQKAKKLYKLPGGGVEGEESSKETFIREVLEETGCIVEIVGTLGYIEEYKSKGNFIQISDVYISKLIKDTKQLHLTKNEQNAKSEVRWMNIEEALVKIKNSYMELIEPKKERLDSERFKVLRDTKILEEYIKVK